MTLNAAYHWDITRSENEAWTAEAGSRSWNAPSQQCDWLIGAALCDFRPWRAHPEERKTEGQLQVSITVAGGGEGCVC